jgi:hypothetical protein
MVGFLLCNVLEFATLGNIAINDHTNNKCDKGLQSLYYDISVEYKCRMWLNKMNHSARSKDKRILAGIQ